MPEVPNVVETSACCLSEVFRAGVGEVGKAKGETMRKVPQVGDYVLATKYKDGDSGDHWAVGFYSGLTGGPGRYGEDPRYDVIDGIGKSFRGNGFRRVEVIAREEGDYLLKNSRDIETSRCNVWGVLKRFRMAKNKSAES